MEKYSGFLIFLCIAVILVAGCTSQDSTQNSGGMSSVGTTSNTQSPISVTFVNSRFDNSPDRNKQVAVYATLKFKNIQDPNNPRSDNILPDGLGTGVYLADAEGPVTTCHVNGGSDGSQKISPGAELTETYRCVFDPKFIPNFKKYAKLSYKYGTISSQSKSTFGPWDIKNNF